MNVDGTGKRVIPLDLPQVRRYFSADEFVRLMQSNFFYFPVSCVWFNVSAPLSAAFPLALDGDLLAAYAAPGGAVHARCRSIPIARDVRPLAPGKALVQRRSPQAQRSSARSLCRLLRTRSFWPAATFAAHVACYQSGRGMDFMHDVHDWMAGYPYGSSLAPDVDALMRRLGFARVHATDTPLTTGLFGSACDDTSTAGRLRQGRTRPLD